MNVGNDKHCINGIESQVGGFYTRYKSRSPEGACAIFA